MFDVGRGRSHGVRLIAKEADRLITGLAEQAADIPAHVAMVHDEPWWLCAADGTAESLGFTQQPLLVHRDRIPPRRPAKLPGAHDGLRR